jgi:NAD(P)-dependent dehydrogenase (short-subunit alcohol dehydrogenase family)
MIAPPPAFGLQGKTILLVGATGAIGRACAAVCDSAGSALVVTGRQLEALRRLRETLHHPSSSFRVLDLEDEAALRAAPAEWPVFDGVVFAAGVAGMKPLRAQPEAEFQRVLRVNFERPALLVRELLRARRIGDGASVVFIGSIAGRRGSGGYTAYSASKAALAGFARSLAAELASRRVRVNTISPGLIASAMADQMNASLTTEQARDYARQYPLGLGTPEDVAHATAFLLSPAARWITATDLVVDGGNTYARQ